MTINVKNTWKLSPQQQLEEQASNHQILAATSRTSFEITTRFFHLLPHHFPQELFLSAQESRLLFSPIYDKIEL